MTAGIAGNVKTGAEAAERARDPERRASLVEALRDCVGAAQVLTDAAAIEPFVNDWRGRHAGAALAVVLPGCTDEVAAVVRACAAAGVRVVPQGGNTGLVGGAVPIGARHSGDDAPVVVALRRMNRIRDIDPRGNTLVADAGCVLETIRQAADDHGRLYGVSLGAQGSCQIGGNVSTNAGGTGVLKYGNTREQVLGLEVVLPDGRVWNGLRRLRKDNTGYALRQLFIGAEGTLGIVTGVALRLHPKPSAIAAAWLTLESVADALAALELLQSLAGERIAGYELLNRAQLETILAQFPEVRPPVDPEAPYSVLVELTDTWARADLTGLLEEALASLADAGRLRNAAIATSEAQRHAFWFIRHSVAEANRKAGVGLACDVAVPVHALAQFVERASTAVLAGWPNATIALAAHMGDGNVHFIPRFRFADWQALPDPDRTAAAVRAAVHDVAVALGGTFSAEHGIGRVLAGELGRLRCPIEVELMRRLRDALDPAATMNPGVLFSEPRNR